jgi:CRISPR/Cas system-associated exonuclease Cas4 (RecB family)
MDPIKKMYLARDEDGRHAIRRYRKPPLRFRASELSDCKRRLWYRLSGFLPAPRTGFQEDWSVDGDIHHDMVRQTMLHWGIEMRGITQENAEGETVEDPYVTKEFTHDGTSFTISSRQDGWVYHEDYGWLMTEIKSVGHWPHHYMVKAYDEGGAEGFRQYIAEKKPGYLYQMTAGMVLQDEERAYLLLKDRSNSHIGIHLPDGEVVGGVVFEYDDEIWKRIQRRCVAVKRAVMAGEPPMPEHTPGSKECGYCPFYYLCHGADKRRKAGLEPAVVYPDPLVEVSPQVEVDDDD